MAHLEQSKTFLTKSLKRLYDEINSAQQRSDYSSVEGFAPYLNNAQSLATELFPNNSLLQRVQKSDPFVGLKTVSYASANLQSIKMRLLQLIDALDIDVGQLNLIPSPISVNITQTQMSLQSNYQSIQNIISNINQLPMSADAKIQAEKLVKEFEQESSSSSPNREKLKSILLTAGSLSKEVGLMLLGHALEKGIITFPKLFG
jgi:hypothetical protein